MQEKNCLISFMQTFGIILVVLGHSFYSQNHCLGYTPVIQTWLYMFHMPLFFFVSGYLLKYGNDKKNIHLADMPLWGVKGFFARKAERLLVPYIILSAVTYLPKALMSSIAVRPVDVSFADFVSRIIYPDDNVVAFFWFIPTLFFIFCLAALAAKTKIVINDIVLLSALTALTLFTPDIKIMCIGKALHNMLFFVAGYMFCKYKMEIVLERHAAATAVTTAAISVAALYYERGEACNIIIAFNGIFLSMALAKLYIRHGMEFLAHIDGTYYTIYLLSWYPQMCAQQILTALMPGITWHVTTPLALFSGIYVPLAIHKWVKSHSANAVSRCMAMVLGMKP